MSWTSSPGRVRYVPLERPRRQQHQGGEYAARRALFLQSYQFSFPADGRPDDEGLRGRLARRLRAAVARAGAGLARAWRGWRPRADVTLLGRFGPCHHHRRYYLHHYA